MRREVRDERRLLKLHRDLASVKLLIIDRLGYVPLSSTGAELLFETFAALRAQLDHRDVQSAEEWTSILGSERLTGALLDRLTHHVSILTMNGDSCRLKQSVASRRIATSRAEQSPNVDPIPANPRTLIKEAAADSPAAGPVLLRQTGLLLPLTRPHAPSN